MCCNKHDIYGLASVESTCEMKPISISISAVPNLFLKASLGLTFFYLRTKNNLPSNLQGQLIQLSQASEQWSINEQFIVCYRKTRQEISGGQITVLWNKTQTSDLLSIHHIVCGRSKL